MFSYFASFYFHVFRGLHAFLVIFTAFTFVLVLASEKLTEEYFFFLNERERSFCFKCSKDSTKNKDKPSSRIHVHNQLDHFL